MATGTTTNYEATRDEIIRDALANVGAVGPDVTPKQAQLLHAARALNRVVKSIDAEGAFLWRIVRRTATLTSGTDNFSPATDVIAVDEPMRYTRSGSAQASSVIVPMSRDEYMALPIRTNTGTPERYFLERTLAQPVKVYMHPVPNQTSATCEYAAVLRSLDFDTGANTPDFWPDWTACLVDGLTAELAAAYGQPDLIPLYRKKFEEEKLKLINQDNELGNVVLVPFGLSTNYGGDY